MALASSYAADCTSESDRNVGIGWFHGSMFFGFAAGPIFGGFVGMSSGPMVIFYTALVNLPMDSAQMARQITDGYIGYADGGHSIPNSLCSRKLSQPVETSSFNYILGETLYRQNKAAVMDGESSRRKSPPDIRCQEYVQTKCAAKSDRTGNRQYDHVWCFYGGHECHAALF